MEREGVIKFELQHDSCALRDQDISALRAWRQILFDLDMVGQDPHRYAGLGFGNLSMRTPQGFLISGSQTGNQRDPGIEFYAEVISWSLEVNSITSKGPVKPSSESLTHAAVYELSPQIGYVFHVHSPVVWRRFHHEQGVTRQATDDINEGRGVPKSAFAERDNARNVDVLEKWPVETGNVDVPKMVVRNMDVPETGAGIAYGTPAMAREVARVCAGRDIPNGFVMCGHEDGVVAYGAEASEVGLLIVELLAESLINR